MTEVNYKAGNEICAPNAVEYIKTIKSQEAHKVKKGKILDVENYEKVLDYIACAKQIADNYDRRIYKKLRFCLDFRVDTQIYDEDLDRFHIVVKLHTLLNRILRSHRVKYIDRGNNISILLSNKICTIELFVTGYNMSNRYNNRVTGSDYSIKTILNNIDVIFNNLYGYTQLCPHCVYITLGYFMYEYLPSNYFEIELIMCDFTDVELPRGVELYMIETLQQLYIKTKEKKYAKYANVLLRRKSANVTYMIHILKDAIKKNNDAPKDLCLDVNITSTAYVRTHEENENMNAVFAEIAASFYDMQIYTKIVVSAAGKVLDINKVHTYIMRYSEYSQLTESEEELAKTIHSAYIGYVIDKRRIVSYV